MTDTRHIPVAHEQIVDLTVDGMGDNGDGLGRIGSYVVFVSGTLPGERARVRITAANRKHGRAQLLQILSAAPDRTTPRCRHFGECGGCQLQHVQYAAQLALKRQRVTHSLSHALRRDVAVAEVSAPDDPWGQRSKVVLHVENRPSGYRSGLYAIRSRRLVPLDECPASHPAAFTLAQRTLAACERQRVLAFDVKRGDGTLRGVLVRATSQGDLGLVLISAQATLPREEALRDALVALGPKAIWVNHLPPSPRPNRREFDDDAPPTRVDAYEATRLLGPRSRLIHGPEHLHEELHGVRYAVSPTSFFQTSLFGASGLVALVCAMAGDVAGRKVIDAYCGSGLFTLALAKRGAQVIGIEDDKDAVADAERSARDNGLDQARFMAGPAQRLLRTLAKEQPHLVVLDPPRAGCHVGVLETVANDLRPERVLYVACDVDSLARDAETFEQLGYALSEVRPVDMFPFTHHVEVVAAFRRNPQVREGRKRFSRAAGERLLAKVRPKSDQPGAPD